MVHVDLYRVYYLAPHLHIVYTSMNVIFILYLEISLVLTYCEKVGNTYQNTDGVQPKVFLEQS